MSDTSMLQACMSRIWVPLGQVRIPHECHLFPREALHVYRSLPIASVSAILIDRLYLPLLEGPPPWISSMSPMVCCVAGGLKLGSGSVRGHRHA